MDLAQGRIAEPSFLEESASFIEIEDAVRLLEKSDSYTTAEEFWDEDGLNRIVHDWIGCFGD